MPEAPGFMVLPDPWTLFWIVAGAYVLALAAGWLAGRAGRLHPRDGGVPSDPLAFLYAPVMPLRNRWRRLRNRLLVRRRIVLLTAGIFLNNLLLAAAWSKILLGLVPLLPLFLVFRTGLFQGAVFATIRRSFSILVVLEFGGYLFAAAIGLSLGGSVVAALALGDPSLLGRFVETAWVLGPWMVGLLLAGAVVEGALLGLMPLPEGMTEDDLAAAAEAARETLASRS